MQRDDQLKGLDLVRYVSGLLDDRRFEDAEKVLFCAKDRAAKESDVKELDLVFTELISLYCVREPKDLQQAERISLERESVWTTAASRLQTAMLYYYSAHDFDRAATKAKEAINLARTEGDDPTVYTSLSLLGLALLKLERVTEALQILGEIETIFCERRRFVVGDETSFLETLWEHRIAVARVKTLASALVRICRNPAHKKKLEVLASEE